MQAHGRLVAHIEDASQPRSDLGSQSDALGLAAGQGAGRSIHRYVVQPDAFQEFDSPFNLFQDLIGNGLLAGSQDFFIVMAWSIRVYLPDPFGGLADIFSADVHYSQSANLDRQGLRPQSPSTAGLAGTGRHISLDLVTHIVRLGPLVTTLQVRNHAFKLGVPLVILATVSAVSDGDLLLVIPIEDQIYMFLAQVFNRRGG